MKELFISSEMTLPFCGNATGKSFNILKIRNNAAAPAVVQVESTVLKYCVIPKGSMYAVVTEDDEFIYAVETINCIDGYAYFRNGVRRYWFEDERYSNYRYSSDFERVVYSKRFDGYDTLYEDGTLSIAGYHVRPYTGKDIVFAGKEAEYIDSDGCTFGRNSAVECIYSSHVMIPKNRELMHIGNIVSAKSFDHGTIILDKQGRCYFEKHKLDGIYTAIAASYDIVAAAGEKNIIAGTDLLKPSLVIPLNETVSEMDISRNWLIYKNLKGEATVIRLDKEWSGRYQWDEESEEYEFIY